MRDFLTRLVGGAFFWFAGLYLLVVSYESPDWLWIGFLGLLGLHLVAAAAAPDDYDGSIRGQAALYFSRTMDSCRLRSRARSLRRASWILYGLGVSWAVVAWLIWREDAPGPALMGFGISTICGGLIGLWALIVEILSGINTR